MSASKLRRSLATCLFIFSFAISSISPFATNAISRHARTTNGGAQNKVYAPHREGELLVRFRPGVSNRDKDAIIATNGARKKKDLDGDSGIEKLEVVTSSDVERNRGAASSRVL